MTEGRTIRDAIADARIGYDRLVELGEGIEDEWTYVTDLAEAWRGVLDTVADARGTEPLGPLAAAALDRAVDEIDRISDPHRAIDWLSTFPQVVLLALEAGS